MNLFENSLPGPEHPPASPPPTGAAGSPLRPLPTPKAPRLNRNALTIIAAAAGMIVVALVIFIQPSAPNSATRSATAVPPTGAGTYLDQPLRRAPATPAGSPAPTYQPDPQEQAYPPYPGPQAGDRASAQPVAYDPVTETPSVTAAPVGTPREPTAVELRVAAFRRALLASPVAGMTRRAAPERARTDNRLTLSPTTNGLAVEPRVESSGEIPALPSGAAGVPGAAEEPRTGIGELPAGLVSPRSPAEQFMQTVAQRGQRGQTSQALTVDSAPGRFTVQAGTVIPAVLMTEINSDLPGECLAQITRDVLDSRAQQAILIPRGAKLLCTYDDQLAAGQDRLLVAWTRILLPDGRSISLPGLPAVDQAGARGVADRVDRHARRTFGTAAALSLISAGAQLAMPQRGSVFSPPSIGQVAAQALGQQLNQVAVQMLQRDLQSRPTIRIRQGTEFNVFLSMDLTFPGPYDAGARATSDVTRR